MRVADYMQRVAAHYYAGRDPFGKKGDFTTAPEISQLFGEMVGIWLAHSWQEGGSPDNTILAELGPGRGTLMHDILRATKHVPTFHDSISLHLVEQSPVLKKLQQERLSGYDVTWHSASDTLPEAPLLLVANEFFDALPIAQYVRQNGAWHERVIALEDNRLVFSLAEEESTIEATGVFHETCPQAHAIITTIAEHIHSHGGAALIIDYGYSEGAQKDTLQAVKAHQYHNPLQNIGEADLTAHVDFRALARHTNGSRAYIGRSQRDFLTGMGIHLRLERLMASATDEQKEALARGVERLTNRQEMGTLFQCMAITQKNTPLGFDDDDLLSGT